MERDVLGEILIRKRREVARRRRHARLLPGGGVSDPHRGRRAQQGLVRGGASRPCVIAEIKFRSPSAGEIRSRAPGDAVRIGASYARAGARGLSVLTDGPAFGGSVLDVSRVASAVHVPVLFKEFVIDPIQVRVARLAGAALVLLIVRALTDEALRELILVAREEGLEPVVEVADEAELEKALRSPAAIIGVNARDLRTFRVDTGAALRYLAHIPPDRVAVLMSGIVSNEDMARASESRADAVLIGSGLMGTAHPGARLRALLGVLGSS